MYQRASIADFLDDFVVYRNLQPAAPTLRGLDRIWPELGFQSQRVPRKNEARYAKVLLHILGQAQVSRGIGQPLRRLLYIGDTHLLDGTAYRNLRSSSGWPGSAFICSEAPDAPMRSDIQGDMYLTNRWSSLGDFLSFSCGSGISIDASTAAVIDLDKTTLGARGRNHRAIDAARVDGVWRTMQDTLGSEFDAEAFRAAYDRLNQSEHHHFTGDNQDILAYVCLMLVGGVQDEKYLYNGHNGSIRLSFSDFLSACSEALGSGKRVSEAVRAVHGEVGEAVARGDPTPFKSFRRREYLTTIARMDSLPDDTPEEQLLAQEITLTREVMEAALWLKQHGVLCFGISDKPDEASLPTPAQASTGRPALHHATMKVTGSSLSLGD